MKKLIYIITILVVASTLALSCKSMAKAALKHWTKKQVKEFVKNCEEKSAKFVGQDKAAKFCNCAVDVVADKYKNYEEAKQISVVDILKLANDCK